jgi:hypothetical protein
MPKSDMSTPHATIHLTRQEAVWLDTLLANIEDHFQAYTYSERYASVTEKVNQALHALVDQTAREKGVPYA